MPDENPSESVAVPETASEAPEVESGATNLEAQGAEGENPEGTQEASPPAQPEPEKKPVSPELAELTRRAAIAARIEKRAQEREAEVSRREREIAEREASFTNVDELEVLQRVAKAKGVDFNTLLRRAIQRHANNGELAPEEAVKAREEERDRELRELKEWKQEREAERAREAQARQVQEWQNGVVSLARASTESLPYLADLLSQPGGDSEVAQRAAQVAGAYYRKTGEVPDNTELVEFLEAQEQQAVDAHYARLKRLGKISEAQASSTGPGNPKTGEQASGPAKTAKTLTNNGASQRAASADLYKMSERERIAYAAQLLD